MSCSCIMWITAELTFLGHASYEACPKTLSCAWRSPWPLSPFLRPSLVNQTVWDWNPLKTFGCLIPKSSAFISKKFSFYVKRPLSWQANLVCCKVFTVVKLDQHACHATKWAVNINSYFGQERVLGLASYVRKSQWQICMWGLIWPQSASGPPYHGNVWWVCLCKTDHRAERISTAATRPNLQGVCKRFTGTRPRCQGGWWIRGLSQNSFLSKVTVYVDSPLCCITCMLI